MSKEAGIKIRHGKGPLFAQMPWALQDAEWVTAYTLAVYAALRRYADFNGTKGARPSLATLSAKSHTSRTKLRQELIKLKKHGWVDWVSGGPTTTNEYTVNSVPSTDSSAEVEGRSPQDLGPNETQGGSPQDPGYVPVGPRVGPGRTTTESQVPEPLPKALTEIGTAAKPPTDLREEQIKEVFTYWQTTLGYQDRQLTNTSKTDRRPKINARFEDGFTVEQLKAVVDYAKQDPFLQGDNDRHRRYDDIENLFRNKRRVEQYLARKMDPRSDPRLYQPQSEKPVVGRTIKRRLT